MPVLASALLEQVSKYCGPCRLNVRKEFSSDLYLQGRLFRPLWDLLFILFDNIAKYAGLELVQVDLVVKEQGDTLSVEVINELGPTVNREVIHRKVAEAKTEFIQAKMDLLRREGGSGFHKIHKILRYDLHFDLYTVSLGLTDSDRFRAAVTFPAGDIYDDNPSD